MKHTIELDVIAANKQLQGLTAMERVRWAVETFGKDAVLLSSMQSSASVLMHYFYSMELENEILFVDTGYHFRETLQLRDEFMRCYKLNMVTLYPELTPEQQEKKFEKKLYLYADGQKECCRLRKTVPFISHMKQSGHKLAMVGLRRSEGGRRAKLFPLIQDPRIAGYTLHPIFDWTDEQIQTYLQQDDVPVHPLYKQNYPSIGCECCTTPVEPGEDPRAGRWRHLAKADDEGPKYCNINCSDGSGI
ncbi:MAG: phosphoadenosine phosphosulfate reductase [Planctomycetota bacterium]|nr:phosphoadenosine phosphosulfate reductase [Planctomycetota bacterium]